MLIVGVICISNDQLPLGWFFLVFGAILVMVDVLNGKNVVDLTFGDDTVEDDRTDLDKLRDTFDDLGIQYHELEENDSTFIQVLRPHETPGKVFVGPGLSELERSSQLIKYFEFNEDEELISWKN